MVRRNGERKSFEIPAEPVAAAQSVERDWNQWRGPGRDGRVAEGTLEDWGETAERVWRAEVGTGHSSPVVADGRVFTLTRQGGAEVVTSIELESGRIAWRKEYPVEIGVNPYAEAHGRWPRSTPLVVDGRLFTLGADATSSAWDATTGDLLWRHAREGGVDTSELFCGTSMSPLHAAGQVFVHVGDDAGGAMIAYDAEDGSEVWRTELEGPGYASPVRVELGGVDQLVTLTMSRVVAVALEDGELLWSVPFEDEWNENIVTPLVHDREIVVAGVRNGMRSLRPIPPSANAETEEAAAWQVETDWINRKTSLYMSSPVLDGDTFYGFSKERRGLLIAVSLADGEVLWTHEEATDNASLVLAGGRLVVLTTGGDLIVGTSTPNGWATERRYEVAPSATWAHPVLLPDGFLIKDASELVRWRVSSSGG